MASGPPLTPCVRCNHADWSADDMPSGRIFSVRCRCGRGTAGFDRLAVIDRWDHLARDGEAAAASARWKAEGRGRDV